MCSVHIDVALWTESHLQLCSAEGPRFCLSQSSSPPLTDPARIGSGQKQRLFPVGAFEKATSY